MITYLDGLTELNCKGTTDNFENYTGYFYAVGVQNDKEQECRGKKLISVVKFAANWPIITDIGRIG